KFGLLTGPAFRVFILVVVVELILDALLGAHVVGPFLCGLGCNRAGILVGVGLTGVLLEPRRPTLRIGGPNPPVFLEGSAHLGLVTGSVIVALNAHGRGGQGVVRIRNRPCLVGWGGAARRPFDTHFLLGQNVVAGRFAITAKFLVVLLGDHHTLPFRHRTAGRGGVGRTGAFALVNGILDCFRLLVTITILADGALVGEWPGWGIRCPGVVVVGCHIEVADSVLAFDFHIH